MDDIIQQLTMFAPLFSERVWFHAQLLLIGSILAPGKRTVSSVLRVMGHAADTHFVNFHRVLSRAQWSTLQGSGILLGILVDVFVPQTAPLVLGADDTVERRRGKKIRHLGCYRDAVRSSQGHVIRCFGLKWVCMMLLVEVPWSDRTWGLPFLSALSLPAPKEPSTGLKKSRKDKPSPSKKKKKIRRTQTRYAYRDSSGHKTSVDWIRQMLKQVHRWFPQRLLVLIVDGGLASIGLGWSCVGMGATMVSRLRWDARLYHPPGVQPLRKRGRKPKKGKRQRSLKEWANRSDTPWQEETIAWYGGEKKTMLLFSRTALWHTPGWNPLPIRFVLVRDPQGKLRDEVFFSTDLNADPVQILQWVIQRWSVEVTFEEARAHLGMETQRQWSDKAIQRTTPVVLALYSIVTWLTAQAAQQGDIPIQKTAWYHKEKATFSDCLCMIRQQIWKSQAENYVISTDDKDITQFNSEIIDLLVTLAYPKAA